MSSIEITENSIVLSNQEFSNPLALISVPRFVEALQSAKGVKKRPIQLIIQRLRELRDDLTLKEKTSLLSLNFGQRVWQGLEPELKRQHAALRASISKKAFFGDEIIATNVAVEIRHALLGAGAESAISIDSQKNSPLASLRNFLLSYQKLSKLLQDPAQPNTLVGNNPVDFFGGGYGNAINAYLAEAILPGQMLLAINYPKSVSANALKNLAKPGMRMIEALAFSHRDIFVSFMEQSLDPKTFEHIIPVFDPKNFTFVNDKNLQPVIGIRLETLKRFVRVLSNKEIATTRTGCPFAAVKGALSENAIKDLRLCITAWCEAVYWPTVAERLNKRLESSSFTQPK